MEATQMFIKREMNKDVICIVEYYSAIKGKNTAICSNMDGSRDCHSEWNKSDTERQISHDIAYMWTLKNGTNEFILKI